MRYVFNGGVRIGSVNGCSVSGSSKTRRKKWPLHEWEKWNQKALEKRTRIEREKVHLEERERLLQEVRERLMFVYLSFFIVLLYVYLKKIIVFPLFL